MHPRGRDGIRAAYRTPDISGTSRCAPCDRARVVDRFGETYTVRALIDQGSEISVVTEALTQRMRLPRAKTSITVLGVGGLQSGVARGSVKLEMLQRTGNRALKITALVLPRLTAYAGVSELERSNWDHLRDLDLADPDTGPGKIDVYAAIIGTEMRRGFRDSQSRNKLRLAVSSQDP